MLVEQLHPGTAQLPANSMSEVAQPRVEIRPGDGAKRISASWDGVSAEIAQFVGSGPFDYKFCAPFHLLSVIERAVRSAGETSVGRSLKSSRRDFGGTLALVPAGGFRHRFRKAQPDPAPLLRERRVVGNGDEAVRAGREPRNGRPALCRD